MKKIDSCFFKACFTVLLLVMILPAFAQNVTLRGSVRDASGQGLAGASVTVQGLSRGTLADNSGNYSISIAPGNYTLTVSYVGFATQNIPVTVGQTGAEQDIILTGARDLGAVTVVGSRSAARTRIETPVPVDVIPLAQVINDVGQVDLNQIMNFIAPSFQSARQTIADGTDHQDPAQLRGLGTDQILVLINGKRRHQSALVNVNGTVNRGQVGTDLSAIPATAIERVEILRDGAAAQYGSDAIAGVINLVLKKRTGLIEAGVSYGGNITRYDKNFALFKQQNKTDDPSVKVRDGENFQASLGYGFNIGKGYLALTGEYINRQPTNRAGTVTGRVFGLVNGQNRDDSIFAARGLSINSFDLIIGNSAMKGGNLFYNAALPVGDKAEIYLFGGYGRKNGSSAGFYRYPNPQAGLTASVTGGAGSYASQALAFYPNGFLPQINTEITDFSSSLGFRTKFGAWNFDISNTFGMNRFHFNIDNSINYSQFAVSNTPQTSFDAGGLKFFQNTINADVSRRYDVFAGLNVATGLEYRIDGFGIKEGEEASFKNYNVNSGAGAGAQVFAGFRNFLGDDQTRNAKAAYLDIEQEFSRKFLVTGALRYERYSDFGSTLNYKLASRFKFAEGFNLRASINTGFRAPSQQQKYYQKTNTLFQSTSSGLVQTESGTFTNDSKAAQILGIPQLKEETSRSFSVGLASRPFRNFELTVDAYQIDIDDRIVLTNNFTGGNNQALKDQLREAGATTVNFFSNAIDTRARGIESVLSYNKTFTQGHSLRTTFALTIIDNRVKKDAAGKAIIYASPVLVSSGELGNYFNREDQSRIEVANPRDKMNLAFNYRHNKFGALLRFVRFGKVQYLDPTINPDNPTAFPVNAFTGQRETLDQEFSAKTVTDLSLSYDITKTVSATVGANNLFDVYQDRHTHSGNMSFGRFVYSRRVQQMGFNGAYYFARLRLALPTR